MAAPSLIADLGGTNARFALVDDTGCISAARVFATKAFPSLIAAATAFLTETQPAPRPAYGAFAVASPLIGGDRVQMTNLAWAFSIEETRRALGLTRLRVINDFAAIAESIPVLESADLEATGGKPDAATDRAPRATMGPGTGLGAALLVSFHGQWQAIATEGGHATLAAATEREARVIAKVRERLGHVSAERALSGPGLVNLARAVAALNGDDFQPDLTPEEISRAAAGGSAVASEAIRLFAAFLGQVAGNQVLIAGARGGHYIAGGVVLRLGALFDRALFRERFEDKGRFRRYLAPVPTWIVTAPQPALRGLARIAAATE